MRQNLSEAEQPQMELELPLRTTEQQLEWIEANVGREPPQVAPSAHLLHPGEGLADGDTIAGVASYCPATVDAIGQSFRELAFFVGVADFVEWVGECGF